MASHRSPASAVAHAGVPTSSSPTAARTTTATVGRSGAGGVKPVIARLASEQGSGLGRWRWVVERTFPWLHNFRRPRIRWARHANIHSAFLTLWCALICWRRLEA